MTLRDAWQGPISIIYVIVDRMGGARSVDILSFHIEHPSLCFVDAADNSTVRPEDFGV